MMLLRIFLLCYLCVSYAAAMEMIEEESGNVHAYNTSLYQESELQEEEKEQSLPSIQMLEVSERDIDVQIAQNFFYNHNMSMLSHQSHESELDVEKQLIEHMTQSSRRKKYLKIGGAALLGGVSGAAMTPVFLENIECIANSIGLQLSADDAFVNTLIYSTMALLVTDFTFSNVSFAVDERQSPNSKYHWLGKTFLAMESLLPVLMLWNVEKDHQQSAQSSGFDEYMAVFTIGAMPLFISSYMYGNHIALDLSYDEKPLTKTEKYLAYSIPAFNSLARGIMGYALSSAALETVSDNESVNVIVPVIAGVVVSNAFGLLKEINGLKGVIYDLRVDEPFSWKNCAKKTGLVIMSAYQSLPYASSIIGDSQNYLPFRSVLALQMFTTNCIASVGTYLRFMKTFKSV